MNIVVSLTTSPKRLPLIGNTLDSIINQTIKPSKIYVNIPPIFKRTNETYPDPNVIFKDKNQYKDIVIWNNNCEDLGPITKLQGTLDNIDQDDNTWIITIDDDIMYLKDTIEMYHSCITKIKGSNNNAYGMAGFIWTNSTIRAQFENGNTNILEGYGSVCYHRSQFPNKSWGSYLNKCLTDVSCKFSDDIIISNWLSLRGVNRVLSSTPWVSRKLMWANKCILEYGNQKDALHNGGGIELAENNNMARYMNVKKYLAQYKLLSKEFQ